VALGLAVAREQGLSADRSRPSCYRFIILLRNAAYPGGQTSLGRWAGGPAGRDIRNAELEVSEGSVPGWPSRTPPPWNLSLRKPVKDAKQRASCWSMWPGARSLSLPFGASRGASGPSNSSATPGPIHQGPKASKATKFSPAHRQGVAWGCFPWCFQFWSILAAYTVPQVKSLHTVGTHELSGENSVGWWKVTKRPVKQLLASFWIFKKKKKSLLSSKDWNYFPWMAPDGYLGADVGSFLNPGHCRGRLSVWTLE
jgi:hypothetical protein